MVKVINVSEGDDTSDKEWSFLTKGKELTINCSSLTGNMKITKRSGFSVEFLVPVNGVVKITGDGEDFNIESSLSAPAGIAKDSD